MAPYLIIRARVTGFMSEVECQSHKPCENVLKVALSCANSAENRSSQTRSPEFIAAGRDVWRSAWVTCQSTVSTPTSSQNTSAAFLNADKKKNWLVEPYCLTFTTSANEERSSRHLGVPPGGLFSPLILAPMRNAGVGEDGELWRRETALCHSLRFSSRRSPKRPPRPPSMNIRFTQKPSRPPRTHPPP